ncbi:MAG: type II toxin-antitoxin system VapC family toxin [Caldilineaceae bacterium SB0670_bin_27]|uniref:Type II toxin-antitoxin system VapC family toxin n=1 Tax=Caldilineaceae bacterium SB0664_bin_27 TaxID=2605260 RepID=A0A6B0YXY1_9CHLR|nr:type II toxin-antitoxin system VapC family toxin [Caldilineaceae bacterium SB0664_bin_27]MYJ78547.1 type II toxin-antitoxin system VapC family toxin [Caldilineaceae bacterium SB0670_bin_27]
MTFIDTGAWIALYDRKDQYHKDACSIFRELRRQRERLYTTDFVIDETVTRLRYDAGHLAAVEFLDAIEGAEEKNTVTVVAIDEGLFGQAKRLFRRYSSERLSFTDCTSFVVCQVYGISAAFAFDRHFPIMGISLLQ